MSIKIGDTLPAGTFFHLTAEGPKTVSSKEIFAGKKIVLFALPGAYTGTCHKTHVPSFVDNAAAIRAKGVDDIVCIAVNDPFVMDAWSKATRAEGKVRMLSDGNGTWSGEVGMTFDGSKIGLGTRSLRYAAIVENGKVTALEVEESPGTCSVSSGSTILSKL